MDFVLGRPAEGRVINRLTIVNDVTHEAVAIEVEGATLGVGVPGALERLALSRSLSQKSPSGGGPGWNWHGTWPPRQLQVCLPVSLVLAFLEVSGQTSPTDATDAQEKIHLKSDRYDLETG